MSRGPGLSPKTLPGTVTKPRNIPGSSEDVLIFVVSHWPASQQHPAKQGCGKGAQQHFPPFPKLLFQLLEPWQG